MYFAAVFPGSRRTALSNAARLRSTGVARRPLVESLKARIPSRSNACEACAGGVAARRDVRERGLGRSAHAGPREAARAVGRAKRGDASPELLGRRRRRARCARRPRARSVEVSQSAADRLPSSWKRRSSARIVSRHVRTSAASSASTSREHEREPCGDQARGPHAAPSGCGRLAQVSRADQSSYAPSSNATASAIAARPSGNEPRDDARGALAAQPSRRVRAPPANESAVELFVTR